ncbi:MAG TPA: hypothetical protein VEJ38_13945 [Candidatus Acidoferrales bacterium]|nr:hypothetical protein [Candidatus Acidoferrales bacterium]
MKRQRLNQTLRGFVLTCAIFPLIAALATIPAAAQDEGGAGLVVSGKATDKDVGLPIYPGAKPHKDPGENTDAARLGLWGGGIGFKLAVLKMESNDSPTQVAEFYKKALSKYGRVLDCTNGVTADGPRDDSAGVLTCADDKPDKGGMLFKAGTKEKQHIVAIEPSGKGTNFALVYVWAKGD